MIRTFAALTVLLVSTAAWSQEAVKTDAAAGATAKEAAAVPATLKDFTYTPKPTDLVYGKEDAPVTMVEYASLSCSHCAEFYKLVFPQLEKNYIETGKLKFVYRNYPLNQPALEAAQMIQCADPATKPTYLKVLFTTQEKWAYDANYKESLAGIAVLGGMDRKKFDECIANKDLQTSIVLGYQEARDTFKVSSTPSLFLESSMLKGNHSYEAVSKAIDEAIAAKAKN